ncbi:MAG: hypothetical protein IKR19_08160 [Acholeplasmatales bacterium]|nr:hypothetical protein [Acholeplasmatales bacterium]
MGIYSSNRFSNLTTVLEEDKEIVIENDDQEIDPDEIPEIDDDVLAMLGDEEDEPSVDIDEAVNDLDSISIEESFSGLLESSINITALSDKFDTALIESEFLSVSREKELAAIGEEVSLTEQKEENEKKSTASKEHINKVIAGAKSSIEQAAAKLATKAEALLKSDKAIYDKYLPYIDKKHLEGFPGIKNFAFPNAKTSIAAKAVSISDISKAAISAANKIKSAKSKEDIDKAVAEFNTFATEANKKFLDSVSKSLEKSENWIPGSTEIGFIKKFAEGNITKKSIAVNMASAKKLLETTGNKIIATAIELGGTEFGAYSEKKLIEIANKLSKYSTQRFKAYKDLTVREIAAVRKAVIICGKYGMKKSSVNESVIENICESSDIHVFEYFED